MNGTVFFFMFGLPVLFGGGAYLVGFGANHAVTVAVVAFLPCWVLAWLSWSMLVPRWRIWAYERVDDLAELKRLAVQQQLLWPQGHFLERTEFRTEAQRKRLIALESAARRRSHRDAAS